MELEQICQTCAYFHQHYVQHPRNPERYDMCSSGHCVYPRCKLRYSETKACQHYQPKPPQDDENASPVPPQEQPSPSKGEGDTAAGGDG